MFTLLRPKLSLRFYSTLRAALRARAASFCQRRRSGVRRPIQFIGERCGLRTCRVVFALLFEKYRRLTRQGPNDWELATACERYARDCFAHARRHRRTPNAGELVGHESFTREAVAVCALSDVAKLPQIHTYKEPHIRTCIKYQVTPHASSVQQRPKWVLTW